MVSLPGRNPNQLLTYYLEVHIYILDFRPWRWSAPTQYGICSQTTFKNARAIFFWKLGRSSNSFGSGENFLGKAAPPRSDTPHRWKRVVIVTHVMCTVQPCQESQGLMIRLRSEWALIRSLWSWFLELETDVYIQEKREPSSSNVGTCHGRNSFTFHSPTKDSFETGVLECICGLLLLQSVVRRFEAFLELWSNLAVQCWWVY